MPRSPRSWRRSRRIPRFTHVAIVHHETTTGRLNDLRALAGLCREHGAALLVDAVSSFGAEVIDFADSGVVRGRRHRQ